MRKRGLTLLEIIIAVALLSLIAVSFLPAISFGLVNLVKSESFIQDTFDTQKLMELEIQSKQLLVPTGATTSTTLTVFDTQVKGHVIKMINRSMEINVFLPQKTLSLAVPIIQSPPVTLVRKNLINLTTQPISIDTLDNTLNIFANDVTITNDSKSVFLMNAYRWYISAEMDSLVIPSNNTKDYFAIKEWNEAKKLLPYSLSDGLKFIPNIKDNYSKFSTKELTDNLSLVQNDLIVRFGNRFIRYGVTPYSIIGRIGKEELSTPIYLTAPRINVISAKFVSGLNRVAITFDSNIGSTVDITKIILNENIGIPSNGYRSNDKKVLILEYTPSINQTVIFPNNMIGIGGVSSETFGNITIWANNVPSGEFSITP